MTEREQSIKLTLWQLDARLDPQRLPVAGPKCPAGSVRQAGTHITATWRHVSPDRQSAARHLSILRPVDLQLPVAPACAPNLALTHCSGIETLRTMPYWCIPVKDGQGTYLLPSLPFLDCSNKGLKIHMA